MIYLQDSAVKDDGEKIPLPCNKWQAVFANCHFNTRINGTTALIVSASESHLSCRSKPRVAKPCGRYIAGVTRCQGSLRHAVYKHHADWLAGSGHIKHNFSGSNR